MFPTPSLAALLSVAVLPAALFVAAPPTPHEVATPAPTSTSTHDGGHAAAPSQDGTWQAAPKPTEPVIVGSGAHRYQWNSSWLQLPEGQQWLGNTHGCIVVDSKDRVYLSADSGDAVRVYAPDGTLERSFGADWGPGLHGLSIASERVQVETAPGEFRPGRQEFLYLAHTARQEVLKTTLEGEVLMRLGIPTESGKYTDESRYRPTSVAVAPDGRMFVADGYGLSWVHRYDSEGKYLGSFGGPGDGEENLRTPHGLWMDGGRRDATLLVADRENHRIARFSLEGEFLGATDPESGLLRRPCHIQFHGRLGVVADLAGRITLLNDKLELVAQLGDNPSEAQRANFGVPPDDWRDGAFTAPHCARFDSHGNLYVMDWNVAGRVTKLELLPEEREPAGPEELAFDAQVLPILENYCIRCHGERRQKGELRLDSYRGFLAGSEYGSIFQRGNAAESRVVELLRLDLMEDEHMPPEDKPQPEEADIVAIEAWINALSKTD